jgi:hypothetical protein
VARFQREKQQSELGPGNYDPKDARYNKPPKAQPKNQVGFNTSENRWQKAVSLKDLDQEKTQQMPGPGAYHVP